MQTISKLFLHPDLAPYFDQTTSGDTVSDSSVSTVIKRHYFSSPDTKSSSQLDAPSLAPILGTLDDREWEVVFELCDHDAILDAAVTSLVTSSLPNNAICRQIGQKLKSAEGESVDGMMQKRGRVFQLLTIRQSESLELCALNLMDQIFARDDTGHAHAKEVFLWASILPQSEIRATMMLQIQKFLEGKSH